MYFFQNIHLKILLFFHKRLRDQNKQIHHVSYEFETEKEHPPLELKITKTGLQQTFCSVSSVTTNSLFSSQYWENLKWKDKFKSLLVIIKRINKNNRDGISRDKKKYYSDQTKRINSMGIEENCILLTTELGKLSLLLLQYK